MKFSNLLSKIKSIVMWSARNDRLFNRLWHPMGRLYQMAQMQHDWMSVKATITDEKFLRQVFPDMQVRYGPLCGLRYPEARSMGSSLVPKLLGSYERELHPIFEEIIETNYSEIIDIGCAEGFYAVGLAKKTPEARVWAYDIEPAALALCQKMAKINEVEEAINFGSFCDPRELLKIPLSRKALILCDCEGYEKTLFTPKVCQHLRNHDVLIEIHDYRDPRISGILRRRFEATHNLQIIQSVPDRLRNEFYHYVELEQYDSATRMSLLAELRPAPMEWFFFRALTISQQSHDAS